MMKNLGWAKDKAQETEKRYHELYAESDEYIQKRLQQASKDGYVDVAFGLRVRTPILKQVIFGSESMPFAAAAEGRTAGNAMGQSYCILNSRAANDFMQKVWKSKHRLDIRPIAQIHDATYFIFKDNAEVVEWVNTELVKSMEWQELEEIKHPLVKLGGQLDIFWPSWNNGITLPIGASQEEIASICKQAEFDYNNPKPKKK